MSNRPKVLYFHHGGAKGGAPLSLLYVLQHLRDQVDAHVVSCAGLQIVVDLYTKNGFIASKYKVPFFAHSTLKSWRLNLVDLVAAIKWLLFYPLAIVNTFRALRTRPDLVHLNSSGLVPYAWLPRALGIPVVCHIREPFAKGYFGVRRLCLRQLLKFTVTHTVAICESNGTDTNLPLSKRTTIYNPVSSDKFDHLISKQGSREELDVQRGAFVALFAGGSNAIAKGVVDFLQAMEIAAREIPELVCLMPSFDIAKYEQKDIRDVYDRLGDKIISADFTYEIEKWISASDLVFALHKTPHFSRTIIEAGMMERPVIAYRIAGLEEVVEDGNTGILVKLDDHHTVAKSTVELWKDVESRLSLGRAGYKAAIERFEAKVSAGALGSVYRKTLNPPISI